MAKNGNGVEPKNETLPVDLTVGVVEQLPPKLQAKLNPLQRLMRSFWGGIVFALIAFTIGSTPVVGVPPVLYLLQWLGWAPHWPFRRFFDQCTANWMSFMTMVYEKLFGVKIRTFGHGGTFKRRSLIIMNHVSHMDWMYLWSVIDRQGDLSFWKVVTKKLPVRSLPILGQCMQMSCFVFIERNWEKDKVEFRDKLYYLNAIDYPVQLLLFPEGGDFTPKMKKRSDQFADENGLPKLDYCFHPRMTGFKYAVNALRDGAGGLDAVYDLTIAYPDVLPKTEVDVGKGVLPKEVHFHVKEHNDKDIPVDQEKLGKWLQQRWIEKEQRLKTFYKYKEFREEPENTEFTSSQSSSHNGHCSIGNGHSSIQNGHVSNGYFTPSNGHVANSNGHISSSNGTSNRISLPRSPEVLRPRNMLYFAYSVFIFIFTNLMLFIPMYYFPYFNIYMVFGALFLCYGHYGGGMGHLYMSFKRKEIEREIKNSKFNQ